MNRYGGIVLCGGKSSRMGQPKAWLPFGGQPLLSRTVETVLQCVPMVTVVAAPNQELPSLPAGVRVARDRVEGQGPLQGLLAGLETLQGVASAAYVTSCDVPFLRPEFIRRILDLLGEFDISVPNIEGYYHPLAAAYRTELTSVVARLLDEGRRRPADLFEVAKTRVVKAAELADVDPQLESLWNVNTPEDYRRAIDRLRSGSTPD